VDNKFTITIHDDKSFKQINLHNFVKKAVLYAVGFLLVVAFIAVGTILYLNYQVNTLQTKKHDIQQAYEKLSEHNSQLKSSIIEAQDALDKKKNELSLISNQLDDIQSLIGLTPNPQMPLSERVHLTKLTSQQIALLMRFIPNGSPVPPRGITSPFGYRINPILHVKEFHTGDDLRAPLNTPIHATANGIIEYAAYNQKSGYGRLIIIDHNYGFQTYFGHLHKIIVKAGQVVKKGQLIGYTGDTGLSSGPHLHYEIRFVQRPLNPIWFLKWNVKNYKEIFQKETHVPWRSLLAAISNLRITVQTQARQSSRLAQQSKGK
jgi:murein DD-endopeptidase MepM/ murein hydrolase activator NlpD